VALICLHVVVGFVLIQGFAQCLPGATTVNPSRPGHV
jgi:hypothetical protein